MTARGRSPYPDSWAHAQAGRTRSGQRPAPHRAERLGRLCQSSTRLRAAADCSFAESDRDWRQRGASGCRLCLKIDLVDLGRIKKLFCITPVDTLLDEDVKQVGIDVAVIFELVHDRQRLR